MIIIPDLHFNIYGAMIILSLLVGFIVLTFFLVRRNMPKWMILAFYMLSFFMIFYCGFGLSYIQNGFNGFAVQYGLSSMGGAIGALLSALVIDLITHGKYKVTDAQIRVLPLIYSIAKVGCFFAGCCRGILYEGFLSVIYSKLGPEEYLPVQLIETVVFAIIFVLGVSVFKNKSAAIIVAISMLMKTILDFARFSNKGIFSFTQIVCVIFAVVILAITIVIKFKNKSKTPDEG